MTKEAGPPSSRAVARDAAFVVHLSEVAGEPGDQAHGRVEHVTSGRAAQFASLDELLRFMRQTLATVVENKTF